VGAEQTSWRAEEEKTREREQQRQEREWKRWRASLRGEELLSQLQIEAQLDLRCLWDVSLDPPRVRGVKLRGPDAGIATPYCRKHDRLIDQADAAVKAGEVESAEEFYRARGAIP
jgi:hypothetical protein